MILLAVNHAGPSHTFWVAPLPFAFLGMGLVAFHYSQGRPGR